MLPNAIPLAGIPITTPDAIPEAALKNDGLPSSIPFKDLWLGLQPAEGETVLPSNALDSVTRVALGAGKPTDLTSLVASDDGVPLPTLQSPQDGSDKPNIPPVSSVPQASSSTTEKDAALPDGKLQANFPSVPQVDVDEPQVAIGPPLAKESISGKADRKTDKSVSVKVKPSFKRTATQVGSTAAVPVVPAEILAMTVSSATIDPNTQMLSAQATPVMDFTVAGGATKLPQEIATVKASSVKWPVAVEQSTSPKNEVADQVNQLVAAVSSGTDDQDVPPGVVAIENTPKTARAVGPREVSFVASTPQPAAIFHASLVREVKSTGTLTVPDEDSALTTAETQMSSVVSGPVSHLDLQWKDGALGNVSVRAEMREGVLHAVVNGSHVSSAVSPTELHQFLEDSRIPVHSLQVNGVEGIKHISEAGQFDANTPTGNGAQTSLSYRDESSRSSARGQEPRNKTNDEDKAEPIVVSAAPMSHAAQPQINRLSIHI